MLIPKFMLIELVKTCVALIVSHAGKMLVEKCRQNEIARSKKFNYFMKHFIITFKFNNKYVFIYKQSVEKYWSNDDARVSHENAYQI